MDGNIFQITINGDGCTDEPTCFAVDTANFDPIESAVAGKDFKGFTLFDLTDRRINGLWPAANVEAFGLNGDECGGRINDF